MSSQSISKGSSRWGSFLQQAVAGVESRLDTILADDDSKPSAYSVNPSRQTPETSKIESPLVPQRSISHDQRSDRRHERLAKAVVARATSSNAQAVDSLTPLPRPVSPAVISTAAAHEDEVEKPHWGPEDISDTTEQTLEPDPEYLAESHSVVTFDENTATLGAVDLGYDLSLATTQGTQKEADANQTVNEKNSPNKASSTDVAYTLSSASHNAISTPPSVLWQTDDCEAYKSGNRNNSVQWQEETRAYMAHIDALQAKLRQLTKEASDVSKYAASEAAAESVEVKLAAKEQKWQEQLRKSEALLETEKKRNSDMRDEISTAKIEKELRDERQRARLRDLQEKFDREKDTSKQIENNLRSELWVLESSLESYRIRAEEASSSDTKDTQSKLLRQTEILQSQYSVATQNWRGIESSLLSRIANVERERDEVVRKENESRRRNREANVTLRRLEEELHQATEDTTKVQETLDQVQSALIEKEKVLKKTQAELEATQLRLKEDNIKANRLAKQLDDLKTFRREAFSIGSETTQHRVVADSPIHHLYSTPSADSVKQNGRPQPAKATLGLGNSFTTHWDRPLSRRQSTQPSHMSGLISPFRQDHLTHQNLNSHTPETPSIRTEQFDDFFDGTATPLTPDRTVNDVLSVSTTAAGPSVQLIERMSAAVRRLESEKASSQDELDRVIAQRDETRRQVMSLMQELEVRKAVSDKVGVLEQEVSSINQRYQTTLEMLGEKSELVEELRADVADVKQMYKDLVETTLR